MPDVAITEQSPTGIDHAHPRSSSEASRELAVQRIFRGVCAAIAGPAIMVGSSVFGIPTGLPFALAMAGFVLGGFGLFEIGRATRHFLRYGSRASQIGFVTAAATGVAVASAGVSNWLAVTFSLGSLIGVIHWSMNGAYTFGTILLLLVLRAVVLWMVDSVRS